MDAFAHYWKVIPGVRAALFKKDKHAGYCQLRVAASDIKSTIFDHPEFTAFNASATRLLAKWKKANIPNLTGFAKNGHPKALIETIAEDLLATFEKAPLLDPYDIYQHLMDYWAEFMQDDCYLIAGDGWKDAAQPRLIIEDKSKKTKTRPDLIVGRKKYQAELIPPALVIARYYAKDQSAIEALEARIATIQQQIEEIAEEHGGEGGLLEDARNDKDKLTKASVTARLKDIGRDRRPGGPTDEDADERKVLKEYLQLSEEESDVSAKLKAAQEHLMEKVFTKYGQLTVDEVKTLVVEDKWLATLATAVQGELDRVSQTLTGRIRQLAERYATPLPQLTDELEKLAARVDKHLKKMGAVWK